MAVPKKRTTMSEKHIHGNYWKRKGYKATVKAFFLGKSFSIGHSKFKYIFCATNNKKNKQIIKPLESSESTWLDE
ncbi:hypothetical protein AMTRI_Chr01g128800 [Amborella trichopoda]